MSRPARGSATLLGLLLFVQAPVGAQSGAAEALLAKHRAFAGFTAGDGSVTSWHLTQSIAPAKTDTAGATPPKPHIVDEFRRGLRYRDVGAGDGRCERQEGFSGRAFWDANANGYVVNVLEDSARTLLSLDALFSDAISALPGTIRGTAKVGDVTVDVVRVTPGAGFPIDLYEDSSGAYRKAVVDPEHPKASTAIRIDGYFDAAGKKIIGTFRDDSDLRYEVTKVDLNGTVSDQDLEPPKPCSTWTFASTDPVSIEFEHGSNEGSRQVNVLATVDGHEGRFLLDSGADGILIFGHFASLLGLQSIGSTSYSGVNGGTIKADYASVKEIAVGKNVLHDVVVVKSNGPAGDVDGILGYDFLAGAIVDVDLLQKQMTILDPASFAPTVPKGAYAFPVDLTNRTPSVRVQIGGKVEARPIIDTGNDFSVLLSSALNSGQLVTGNAIFTGVDGTSERSVPCTRLNLLLVGPYRYENSPVCFGDQAVFGDDGGLIGFDFLRHFNWTFDYPDAKLVLRPNGIN